MTLDKIFQGLADEIVINEMALIHLTRLDFLNALKAKDYEKALDIYLKTGGEIGGRKQPKRSTSALRKAVTEGGKRTEGVTTEMVDAFEKVLLKKHEQVKAEEKELGKKAVEKEDAIVAAREPAKTTEPAKAVLIKKEKSIEAPEYKYLPKTPKEEILKNAEPLPPKEEPAKKPEVNREPINEKELGEYLASIDKDALEEYYDKIIKDYKNGFRIPKEFRKDPEWIASSFKQFNPDKRGGLSYTTQFKKKEEYKKPIRKAEGKDWEDYYSEFTPVIKKSHGEDIKKDYELGNKIHIPASATDDDINTIVANYFYGDKVKEHDEVKELKVREHQATRDARKRLREKAAKGRMYSGEEPQEKKEFRVKNADEREEAALDQASKDIETERIKSRRSNSAIEKNQDYFNKNHYPSENIITPEGEKKIKDLIKDISTETIMAGDTPEIKQRKTNTIIKKAEEILAVRKISISKLADGTIKKINFPEASDEFYPLAKAIYDYKNGAADTDLKKLVLSIRRIGTHAPEKVRSSAVKRLEDEVQVGISEIKALAKNNDLAQLKVIAKDILSYYDYKKSKKPSLGEFRKAYGADENTFEAYKDIEKLYDFVFGVAEKKYTADQIKETILKIKKIGLTNIVDLKAAGEINPEKALKDREEGIENLKSRLKEDIQRLGGLV